MSRPRYNRRRDYSLGHNRHAKACDCGQCATARAEEMVARWKEHGKAAVPKDSGATVFVRSHFRHGRNHLSKQPKTLRTIRELVRTIMRRAR